jgi:DNA-binding SARP family transcriptional activator/tetratricopeptide (TPR) repeat protein
MRVVVRLLGPLEVECAGWPVPIGAAKERLVVAVLALNAGRVVPVERLVDAVWGEDPPESAALTVRGLVSRLRKTLAAAGCPEVITTRSPGYLLAADAVEVDVDRFQALAADGRARLAAGAAGQAAATLRDALALWRGDRLAESDGLRLCGEAARLAEARLATLEVRIDADLATGRHAELVSELEELCQAHQVRERLWGQRMLALYRCGRQADALAAYRQLRTALADELGLDPSDELRRLETAILAHDPTLTSPAAEQPAARFIPGPVPRQLPTPPRSFTGREPELAYLDALLTADAGLPTAMVIAALSGTAGVGKTALAIHWAHRVADRFPDGQLYVNLRGFDPTGSVMHPAKALRGFLDALAVPAQRIPAEPDAQLGLYRSLLADKRLLIVLDNARDAEQVRPLLPGSPTVLVVATSRSQLSGLVAVEGAHPVTLDLLSTAGARELLIGRLGAGRLAAEPTAVDDIITRCTRLPLALAMVAARAATHPGFGLAVLAKELHEASGGLDAFADAEDATTDIRAVFSWSYQRLSTEAARLFRLLGLHPGPDISAAAAASLAGLVTTRVRPLLAQLACAHLILEHTPGRYTFHDLLRAYATEQAHAHDSDTDRHTAVHRMLDHYLHTAHAADRLLYSTRDPITLTPPQPGVTPEHPIDHQQAMAWFTIEHPILLAAVDHASLRGFDRHTWQLAWSLSTFLHRRGHWHGWAASWHTALAAARRLADQSAQAYAHRHLACAYTSLGRLDEAHTHLLHALDLYDHAADHVGLAHTRLHLADGSGRQGRYAEALDHGRQSLDLYRATGHRSGQARALSAVGSSYAQLGNHAQALTACQQALTLHQQLGDRPGEGTTWNSLGHAHHCLGHHPRALACYQRALDLWRNLGDPYQQARTLTNLGDTDHAAGNAAAASATWQAALTILDDLNHPDAEEVRTKLLSLT